MQTWVYPPNRNNLWTQFKKNIVPPAKLFTLCFWVDVSLSSYKESRQYNKRSTIEIGDVAEIPGSKQSVALVNQIRAIDKMRLIGEKALGNFVDKVCEKLNEIDGEFEIQDKQIYRLTKEQYDKILHAVNNYLFVGAVERKIS